MKTVIFTTANGDNHRIDKTGNHFRNEKCVNPNYQSGDKIGSTYPPKDEWMNIKAL